MPRAFTSADILQSVPDTAAVVVDPGVDLPFQVGAGRGGIIVMGGATILDKPSQWHYAVSAGTNDPKPAQLAIMCRADLPGGEQSWPFSAFLGASTNWAWVVEEWANLSFAPLVTAARTPNTSGTFQGASISTGTTGTWDAGTYVVGIAAVLLLNGNNQGSVWPSSVSWSNGFVETDVLSIGNNSDWGAAGSGPNWNDLQLRVARRYGTAGETGPWETTASFTGAMTNKNEFAALAIFRAESHVGDI
jgi:hypothetical protein